MKNANAKVNKPKKKKIVFLCTGNTCRSPMAEFILKDELVKRNRRSEFIVTSAGLSVGDNDTINPLAKEALKTLKVKCGKFVSKPLTIKLAESAHLIVCMTESHRRAILKSPVASEGVKAKTVTVASLTGGDEVSDPFGLDLSAYIKTAQYLAYAMDDIIEKVDTQAQKIIKI